LERMRALSYHRFWRNRWQEMVTTGSIHAHWAPVDEEDIGLWNARMRSDEKITAVVLGSPPVLSSASGNAQLKMALRAGVPVVLWDRREQRGEDFEEVVESFVNGAPAALVNRVKELRSQAAVMDPSARNDHIGRHLTVLWDNPNRLVDVTPYAPLEVSRAHAEEFDK
jgi:hypothetical protein